MGKDFVDLTGMVFGRLTVVKLDVEKTNLNKRKRKHWICVCNCNNEKTISVSGEHLKSGHTKSCGCAKKESIVKYSKGKITNKNNFAQWGIDNIGEDFLEKYWDYELNRDINPWEIGICSHITVYLKCQNKIHHGSYPTACGSFTNGCRCPLCSSFQGKVHHLDSLGKLLEDKGLLYLWSDKNYKSPYEYSKMSHEEVYWKCSDGKHSDYLRKIYNSNIYEYRCPECVEDRKESSIQEKTRLYIESLGYDVFHENRCSLKPKNIIKPPNNNISMSRKNGTLRYDNEITIDNDHLFIEVMGKQHDSINGWHYKNSDIYNTSPQQELDYQIKKDEYKKQYVYEQGDNYYYIAIWYYHFDKEDTYKSLIKNKISSIIKKQISEAII